MSIRCVVSLAAALIIGTHTVNARGQVVNSEWNVGNGNWNVLTNWFPNDVPDNGGGFAYDVQIGNRPIAAGAGVTFIPEDGTSDTVTSLIVSNGVDLFTNSNQLNVNVQTTVDGAGSTIQVEPHNLAGTPAFQTLNLHLNNGGGLVMSSGAIATVNTQLHVNPGSVLRGSGTINLGDFDASIDQAFQNSGLIQVAGSTATPGLLVLHANGVDRIDIDGDIAGETGVVDVANVAADVELDTLTLVIDGPLAEPIGGVGGSPLLQIGQRDTLTFNDDFQINLGTTLEMNGGNNVATLNGAGDITSIAGATFTITGSAVITNDMTFTGTANTIAMNINSTLTLNGTVAIPDASAFDLTGVNQTLVIGGATTITEAAGDFDWDNAETTTVNGTGFLSLVVDQIDLGNDNYGGNLNLNDNGDVSVLVTGTEWTMSGTLTKNNAGTSSVNGDRMVVTGDVSVIAGTLDANAAATLAVGSNFNVVLGGTADMGSTTLQAGANLTINGTMSLGSNSMLAGPATLGGTGLFRLNSNSTVTANTTVNTTSFDWDGTGGGSLHTINDGVVFTVNSTIWDADDAGDVDDPITLGGSGAQIIVNNVPNWTMTNMLTTNTPDVGVATIGGTSRMIRSGVSSVFNVNGNTNLDARVTFGASSTTTIAAAGLLTLRGGTALEVNEMAGGTINGPGLLAADTGKVLRGFGTINANIDFDGTANLLADDGTLALAGVIADVNLIGTNDDDAILNVTNAWNTNVAQALTIRGGEVRGATITNDGTGGILGNGRLSARVINNTKIAAGNGLHLIVETALNDNDWDGTTNAGMLSANFNRTLEVRDVGAGFGFGGTVSATDGGRVFASGFALDFNPASTLSLASGGKYQSSSSTDIGGTVTVGAGGGTIEVENNFFLTFETGSATTLASDLHLVNNNVNIEAGATFSGAGALVVPDGSHMVADNLADIGVLLDMQGALRPGNSEGIGRVSLFDYQQADTGELFVELKGTALNAFDRLVASGDVTLDGYLNLDIDLVSPGVPFVPVLGNTFNIITGNTVTGEFDFSDISGMPDGLTFAVNYLPNAVQLHVVNTPFFSADFDEDGDVDGTDLAIWDGAFDLNQLGDADGDNDTDGADLILWQQQFGSRPGGPPGITVPEPTSLLLLLIACLTCAIALGRHRGMIRVRRAIVSTILTFALAHTAVAQTVNLSLNVEYSNPANLPLGGAWTLVAKTDSAFGISSINAILSNIHTAGITYQAGIGAFLNNGVSPFVAVDGTTVEVVYLQDLSSPASVVTNVGRGAGTPGNLALDFLNDPQWNNSARIFFGTFGTSTPMFTTHGSNVTGANVLRTGVPPFTFALPASVTTIVRNNLGVLGDLWDNTSGSGLWSDGANWADNTEPTAASAATFPGGFPNGDSVITLSAAETAAALTLNDNYTLSGGSLTLPAGAAISVAAGKTAAITSALNVGTWTKSGDGTLAVPNVRGDALTVGAGAVAITPNGGDAGTSVLDSVTINGGSSKLDLNNNDLIVRATALSKDAEHANIEARIVSAQNGVDGDFITNWSGPGITSSFARTANVMTGFDLTGLGVIRNSDIDVITGLPGAAYTSFSGQPVTPDDVLVKYTYIGDGNLDGLVSFDDYVGMDNAFFGLIPNLGWATGDINFDGLINFDDYTVVDQAFFFQGAPLSHTVVSAVPEPGTCILAALAGFAALTFGRNRRWRFPHLTRHDN